MQLLIISSRIFHFGKNGSYVGDFTMNRLETEQYELTIPDESPETGMLIMTVAHRASASGVTAPDDNVLTYEASLSGSFLINSYDLPVLNFQDTKFAWAFISFADPISLAFAAGDYDRDGDVDDEDYLEWKSQYGMSGESLSADGNGDGLVDTADYTVWRDNLSAGAPGSGQNESVPEPAVMALILWGVVPGAFLLARLRSQRQNAER